MEPIFFAKHFLLAENPAGTFLLVTDDSNYCHIIKKAQQENWKIEIWFWCGLPDIEDYLLPHLCLMNLKIFYYIINYNQLDEYYKQFTYITGPDFTSKKHSLEICSSKQGLALQK